LTSTAYRPEQTQRKLLADILRRVFEGSAAALVARLLEQAKRSEEELEAIRRLLADYGEKIGGLRWSPPLRSPSAVVWWTRPSRE
jgi:predicted transcriptional regulator